jgi:hypothetical protein
MLSISVSHNEARLTGSRDFLDTGTGAAKIQIYDNSAPRPANGAGASSALLAEITLDKPCGTVSSGALTLTASATSLVQRTGVALWARVVTASGAHAFDCDVSATGGSGEVWLPSTQLYAGGTTLLVSAVLG